LLGVDPHGDDERLTKVSLGEALSQSDYVMLAVPLLEMTRHLINDSVLKGVRGGQVLVNIGRGSVVDEAAVARALQDGRLGAYAADVYEMEDWLLQIALARFIRNSCNTPPPSSLPTSDRL
ncbi:MAG: NAD(P)-dependent oxidoreductase, partial [Polynucleobacter sp.]|nr:NAD(P)-dependent oxidoreductase [Polynucleobacter sp.]